MCLWRHHSDQRKVIDVKEDKYLKEDTYRQIKIDLDMIQEITEFFLSEQINEHGHCMIKGIIVDGSQDKLVLENRNEDRIRVF